MAEGITHLIINSPYEEPVKFWRYKPETKRFILEEGSRRPAGYVMATPGSRSFDDPGIFVQIPLMNRIRPRVKAWRERG
jgi:type III restriction enzyme